MLRKLTALCCLLLMLLSGHALAEVQPIEMFAAEDEAFLPPGQAPVRTASSYRSPDIAIAITASRVEGTDVYVADIRLRSLGSLRRAYGGGGWNRGSSTVKSLAQGSAAILAITGDSAQHITAGVCIGNGQLLRGSLNNKRDLCVLYTDGVMETLPAAAIDHESLLARQDSIWQTFLFGPVLLDAQGRAMEEFNTSVNPANPRSAIGYYAPGHYCFVQVDGRRTASALEKGRTNAGMTMQQLSALMESLGCAAAYNLDGGQSSMLWFDGQVISTPYHGGRPVGDIVLIAEDAPLPATDDSFLVEEGSP